MSVCFPYKIQETSPLIAEPIIDVTLKNRDNPSIFLNTELFLDTGAFISLAPRSYGDLLELNLYEGIPLNLTGISGGHIKAYAHLVSLDFRAGIQAIDLPIAITEKDFPPNFLPPLLGNLGVWEQIGTLNFDNTNQQLCLSEIQFKDQTPTMNWLRTQALKTKVIQLAINGLVIYTLMRLATK